MNREEENRALMPRTTMDLRGGNPAGPHGGGDQFGTGVRGEIPAGPLQGPCSASGNDGRRPDGNDRSLFLPPPGLSSGDQHRSLMGYHGPIHVRGGDPVVHQGSSTVPGGEPDGGARGQPSVSGVHGSEGAGNAGLAVTIGNSTMESGAQGSGAAMGAANFMVQSSGPMAVPTTTTASSGGGAASGGAAAPKTGVDPFDMLAKGMAQLQNAMAATMTNKGGEPEQVKPGISELPRLPEPSETSCIDIGDWLHSLECPMGDLSNSSAAWWQEVMSCLDRFYAAYLKSSNLSKLSLKPETFASAVLKEDKWSRVDKRATSMLLASLPESVRTEILASRLTGALQVLGRVMVLYRPGSTAERQQILKALELPPTATNAAEAVDALRRWARWLRRAGDVGLQSPDPSILLRGLDGVVRKVLQENGEILFRINMMRYTLEVDVKPTQKAVEDLHQALLSEFEQVAFRGRTRPSTAPSLKAASAVGTTTATMPTSGSGEGHGGESPPTKGKGAPCKFFLTDQGCRRGAGCKHSHEVDRKQKQGRCWTCGSKQHVSRSCPTKDKQPGGRSPTRPTTTKPEPTSGSPTLATMAPENTHPAPPVPSTSPAVTTSSAPSASTASSSSTVEHPSQAQPSSQREEEIRSLLKEANNMLKEMRQLRMLTVGDVTASAKSIGMDPETGRTGLLDSGASHLYRPGTDEELRSSNSVRVQLANGEEVTLAQNRAGTLLAKKASPDDLVSPIVPLGSLVQDLNCELTWGKRRGLEIRHPTHGTIRPKVIGQCPLIGEAQALELIRELEEKRWRTYRGLLRRCRGRSGPGTKAANGLVIWKFFWMMERERSSYWQWRPMIRLSGICPLF